MGHKGMTLIEILIVISILAIMAAVAVGIYRPYIHKARRSDAFTALKACWSAQEMYRAENGLYSCNFTDLPGCSPNSPKGYYRIAFGACDENGTFFSFVATPTGPQAGDRFAFCIDENGTEYYGNPNASGRCPGGNWTQGDWEKL